MIPFLEAAPLARGPHSSKPFPTMKVPLFVMLAQIALLFFSFESCLILFSSLLKEFLRFVDYFKEGTTLQVLPDE